MQRLPLATAYYQKCLPFAYQIGNKCREKVGG